MVYLITDDDYLDILDNDLAHIQISLSFTNDQECLKYEKATPPSKRIKAIRKLENLGYDVSTRLAPFLPNNIDYDLINNIGSKKILVEFLRVNSWIMKWFNIGLSDYTLKEGGYRHLPLQDKINYLNKITGFKEVSVCEDVNEHFIYWQENVNANKDDCCNLRL